MGRYDKFDIWLSKLKHFRCFLFYLFCCVDCITDTIGIRNLQILELELEFGLYDWKRFRWVKRKNVCLN